MRTIILFCVFVLNFVHVNAQKAAIIDSTTISHTRNVLLKFLGGKINADNAFRKLSDNKAYFGMIAMFVGDDELLSELKYSSDFMKAIMPDENTILSLSRNSNIKFPGMAGKRICLQLMFRNGRDESITNVKDFDDDFRKSLALMSGGGIGEYIFLQPKVFYFLSSVDKRQ